jgi:hypothetical protein
VAYTQPVGKRQHDYFVVFPFSPTSVSAAINARSSKPAGRQFVHRCASAGANIFVGPTIGARALAASSVRSI